MTNKTNRKPVDQHTKKRALSLFYSPHDLLWDAVQCPGLTQSAKDINHLKNSLARQLKAFNYKQKKSLLWAVFIGGTGTGKSTLFNALCRSYISETGVERPKTAGTIVYVHKKIPLEE
ncbi:unnamed protein product, partial [marine sediment metagenome]